MSTNNNNGRLPAIQNSPLEARYKCFCEPDTKKDEKELAREERRRLKEERLKKKERKLRKKAKLEKECLTEKMNCFEHDNDHWRTAPLWNAGPFCFCMNANNNTYSCIRTINVTHNFLYCEFTTGLVTFYNLRIGEYDEKPRIDFIEFPPRGRNESFGNVVDFLWNYSFRRNLVIGKKLREIIVHLFQIHSSNGIECRL